MPTPKPTWRLAVAIGPTPVVHRSDDGHTLPHSRASAQIAAMARHGPSSRIRREVVAISQSHHFVGRPAQAASGLLSTRLRLLNRSDPCGGVHVGRNNVALAHRNHVARKDLALGGPVPREIELRHRLKLLQIAFQSRKKNVGLPGELRFQNRSHLRFRGINTSPARRPPHRGQGSGSLPALRFAFRLRHNRTRARHRETRGWSNPTKRQKHLDFTRIVKGSI